MWGRVIIVWADSPHPAFLFILQELQGSSHNQISLCDLAVSQNRFGITFWGGFSVNSPPILANLSFRAWIFHWRFTKGANHWALDFDHRPWPVFQKVPPRTFISPHGQAVLQREGPWRVLRLQARVRGSKRKRKPGSSRVGMSPKMGGCPDMFCSSGFRWCPVEFNRFLGGVPRIILWCPAVVASNGVRLFPVVSSSFQPVSSSFQRFRKGTSLVWVMKSLFFRPEISTAFWTDCKVCLAV